MIEKQLKDLNIENRLKVVFGDYKPETAGPGKLKPMEPCDSWGSNSGLRRFPEDFNRKYSDSEFDQFIKDKLEKDLGLVKKPTEKPLEQIINKRQSRPKSKTVYYKHFVDQMNDLDDNISDFEYDVIDAEIVEKTLFENPIRVKAEIEF